MWIAYCWSLQAEDRFANGKVRRIIGIWWMASVACVKLLGAIQNLCLALNRWRIALLFIHITWLALSTVRQLFLNQAASMGGGSHQICLVRSKVSPIAVTGEKYVFSVVIRCTACFIIPLNWQPKKRGRSTLLNLSQKMLLVQLRWNQFTFQAFFWLRQELS